MIQNVSQDPDIKVSDLICPITNSWNIPLIDRALGQGYSETVKQIRLSRFSAQDKQVWPCSKNLEYSVKSGYWATTHDLREGDAIIPSMGSFDLKMECWKINIIPKIKNFLWKLLSGALATYTQLCSRGIRVSPICQRCCVEEETINHVLFECPHAIAIW